MNKYSIVITGSSGSGKSSICNFYCRENRFNVTKGLVAVSDGVTSHTANVCGKRVELIDSPGIFDDQLDTNYLETLSKSLAVAKNGVNAIGMVIRVDTRFTLANAVILKQLDKIGDIWPFVFIIFSHGNKLGSTNSDIQKLEINQYLEDHRCPGSLKNLVSKINSRYIVLESVESFSDEVYYNAKAKEFITIIHNILTCTGSVYRMNAILCNVLKEQGSRESRNVSTQNDTRSYLTVLLETLNYLGETVRSYCTIH